MNDKIVGCPLRLGFREKLTRHRTEIDWSNAPIAKRYPVYETEQTPTPDSRLVQKK